jgi:hypothetical protein
LRARDKARHAELRAAVGAARKSRKLALARIADLCASLRGDLRRRARELRAEAAEHRASARALEQERAELGASCSARKVAERERQAATVERARSELAEHREEQRRERVRATFGRPARSVGRSTAAKRSAERRSESAEEVAANIPPELVPLWERVARSIHAGPRMSRTEAFLRFVEENPDAQWELAEQQAADELRRLEREQRAHARAVRKTGRYRSAPAMLAAGAKAPEGLSVEPEDDLPF